MPAITYYNYTANVNDLHNLEVDYSRFQQDLLRFAAISYDLVRLYHDSTHHEVLYESRRLNTITDDYSRLTHALTSAVRFLKVDL